LRKKQRTARSRVINKQQQELASEHEKAKASIYTQETFKRKPYEDVSGVCEKASEGRCRALQITTIRRQWILG